MMVCLLHRPAAAPNFVVSMPCLFLLHSLVPYLFSVVFHFQQDIGLIVVSPPLGEPLFQGMKYLIEMICGE